MSLNKYNITLLLIALTFTGCGSSATPNGGASQPGFDFLRQVYASADGSLVLDLRKATLNQEQSVYDFLPQCDTAGHRYTNNVAIQDLTPEYYQGGVIVEGTLSTGSIQFGNIKNNGNASDPCRIFSTERYSYQTGDINHLGYLTLTAIAPGKSWNGIVTTLYAQ